MKRSQAAGPELPPAFGGSESGWATVGLACELGAIGDDGRRASLTERWGARLRRIGWSVWLLAGAAMWLGAGRPPGPPLAGRRPGAPVGRQALVPTAAELFAVPVAGGGRAQFELACSSPQEQYLIVVSAMARRAGPFRVVVRSEPVRLELVSAAAASGLKRLGRWRWPQPVTSPRRPESPVLLATNPPRPERSFWIMVGGDEVTRAENYRLVHALLSHTGLHCSVYVDRSDAGGQRLPELVRSVATTFDDEVYPALAQTLGPPHDVDGDGRFTILLTRCLNHLCDDKVSVGGFVRASDFCAEIAPPAGNRCDMMYLNSSLRPGPHLRTIIAHEFTHALALSRRLLRNSRSGPSQAEEDWLNEAIAHVAENRLGYSWSNLDYRISGFLNAPERYELVVPDYYAAGRWRGHGYRGATYLFLRWCVDQFGPELVDRLVDSPLCGVDNLEMATGRSFEELYRLWSAALFLSHSGLPGSRQAQFRSVRLRGRLGERYLAGPRYQYLDLAGETRSFELAGTASQFLIGHSPAAGRTRVRVQAESAAELQVTVCRLPTPMARVVLSVEVAGRPAVTGDRSGYPLTGLRLADRNGMATLLPDRLPASDAAAALASGNPAAPAAAEPAVRLTISEHNGVDVTLEALVCEWLSPGSNRELERGLCRLVQGGELERLFGSLHLPGRGRLAALLPLPDVSPTDLPLLLKLAGHDRFGYAVAAWASLRELPAGRPATKSDLGRPRTARRSAGTGSGGSKFNFRRLTGFHYR